MEVVEYHPYANQVRDRMSLTLVTKVGRTLVTTRSGTVFDTTEEPPCTKDSNSQHYLYTTEEYRTKQFEDEVASRLSKGLGIGGRGIGLDETLYIALALRIEIPTHLQERAHAIHNEITAGLPTAELDGSSGGRERPLPSTGAKVRGKVRA